MSIEQEIHPVQAQILRVLLFQTETRFADLNTTDLTTDHFTFHVKRLVKTGLIKKNRKGLYGLTPIGKEFANRFDTDNVVLERQAKVGVLVVGVRKEKNLTKFLVQQRLKQPFYGYHGFISGKVRWEETIIEAAGRELKEESGLAGELKMASVEHKMDYSQASQFLEDKFFFIVRAEKTKGKLIKIFEGGKNRWLTKKEIYKLPKLFRDVKTIIKVVEKGKLSFWEKKFIVTHY